MEGEEKTPKVPLFVLVKDCYTHTNTLARWAPRPRGCVCVYYSERSTLKYGHDGYASLSFFSVIDVLCVCVSVYMLPLMNCYV